MEIKIIKANGDTDVFQASKLRQSLQRSGVDALTIEHIVEEVSKTLHDGMSTNQIYRTAYRLLKKTARSSAPRYSLKQAIMEMGPSGYPFEHLVARILEVNGYTTQVGITRQGHCVTHEVDVLAVKEDHCISVECKYHNRQGYVCDVKVPLYIQSRFLDLQLASRSNGNGPEINEGWIVTNTRFSGDAINFGECMNLKLISWDYPEQGSLKDGIERAGLYPVTVLTSLKKEEMRIILDSKIVTCTELLKRIEILDTLKLSSKRINSVIEEAQSLCGRTTE